MSEPLDTDAVRKGIERDAWVVNDHPGLYTILQKALTELKTARKDQDDWRKGVELIAGALGMDIKYLACVPIFEKALELRSELDTARKLIETGSCSICGTINLSPPYCSHKQPCRPAYAKLEKANEKIKELESEKQHAENLARYYHDKLIQRDQRIIELKKEKLKAKDDGYTKGWDDASRDGER